MSRRFQRDFIVPTALCILWLVPRHSCAQYAWEALTNKVVVLAVNAHPDDEGIFFGGTLPYYSKVLGMPTVLLSMTSGDWNPANLTVREAELRCAAWTYGLRYEPLFARFRDVPSQSLNPNPYTNKIDATWDYWADGVLQGDGSDVETGKLKAIHYVAEQIRRLRPEIIITHDLSGEYGHHNHQATAYAVTNAFFVAADPAANAPNLAGLPPWQTRKLYLHLYGTNRLFHAFLERPYPELQHRSPRGAADAGLDCHASQGRPDVSTVYRTGENFDGHHSEWWGLYASTVGPDTVLTQSMTISGYEVPGGSSCGNFLENLELEPAPTGPFFTAETLEAAPAVVAGNYVGTLVRWVTDPNLAWGDILSFQKVSGPAWLSVSADGMLSGVPAQADMGTNVFVVQVADAGGLSATATLRIRVVEPFPNVANLVGWWKLDETTGLAFADSAWPAQDGAGNGAVTLGHTGARMATATAAYFDGTNSKVDVAWAAELNPLMFTACLWAKVTGGAGTYRSPLTSRESTPQSGYVFYAAQNNVWQLWLGATNSWKILSAGPVVSDIWMHLAATYDGSTARFYTNGSLASTLAVTLRPNQNFPLRIGSGGSESAGQYWFPGFVDDVRIYRVPLPEAQIGALYSNRAPAFQMDPMVIAQAFAGTPLSGQTLAGTATDANAGDTVGYGKLQGPAWLSVARDGQLSGLPLTADVGQQEFQIGASDAHGALSTATLRVDVQPGRAPVFTTITKEPGPLTRLTLSGAPGQTYLVEAAPNLESEGWRPVGTNHTGASWFETTDPDSGEQARQFYRARVP